ncbi:MAG: hypothetical protein M0010_05305 [Actinomycetota bacterium]|nr:hypothetical protein [Actinomycetota bacterium]
MNAAVAGDTIDVCAGTFHEQVKVTTQDLTVTGPASGTPAIIEPSTVSCNTEDLQTHVPTAAVVLVSVVSGVTVEHLTVNGASGGATTFTGCTSSPQNFWGIVYQNASGTISNDTVENLTPSPSFSGGNNNDDAIFVQSSTGTSTLTISANTAAGYQKNGITCNGAGTTCSITGNTVTGAGPISTEAQNGIQVGFGATGSAKDNTVSNNDAANFAGTGTASGVLVTTVSNTSVIHNTLTNNQDAVVLAGYGTKPTATMTGDTVSTNTIHYTSSYTSTSSNAASDTEGVEIASVETGPTVPSITAVIRDNTVDGPGAFSLTPATVSVHAPVGMEVGYFATTAETGPLPQKGSLTISATGNTVENWAADVMDLGTTSGTDSTTLTGNNLLSAPFGVDNL